MRTFRSHNCFLIAVMATNLCFATSDSPVDEASRAGNHGGAEPQKVTGDKASRSKIVEIQSELVHTAVTKIGECGSKTFDKKDKTLMYFLKEPLYVSLDSYIQANQNSNGNPEKPLGASAFQNMFAARYGYKSFADLANKDTKLADAVKKLAAFYSNSFKIVYDRLRKGALVKDSSDQKCSKSKGIIGGYGDSRSTSKQALCEYNLLNEIDGKNKEHVSEFQKAEDDLVAWVAKCKGEELGNKDSVADAGQKQFDRREAKSGAEAALKVDGSKLKDEELASHKARLEKAKADLAAHKPKNHEELTKKIDEQLSKLPGATTAQAATQTTAVDPEQAKLTTAAKALVKAPLSEVELADRGALINQNGWTGLSDAEVDAKIAKIKADHEAEVKALVSDKKPEEIKAGDAAQLKKEEPLIAKKIKELEAQYKAAVAKVKGENSTPADILDRDALKASLETYRRLQINNKALQQRALAEAQPELFKDAKPTVATYTAAKDYAEAKKSYDALKEQYGSAPAYKQFIEALESTNPYSAKVDPGADQNLQKIQKAYTEMKKHEQTQAQAANVEANLNLASTAQYFSANKSKGKLGKVLGGDNGYVSLTTNPGEQISDAAFVKQHSVVFEEAMKISNVGKRNEFLTRYFDHVAPAINLEPDSPSRGSIAQKQVVGWADEFVSNLKDDTDVGAYVGTRYVTEATALKAKVLANPNSAEARAAKEKLKQMYLLNTLTPPPTAP